MRGGALACQYSSELSVYPAARSPRSDCTERRTGDQRRKSQGTAARRSKAGSLRASLRSLGGMRPRACL